MANLKTKYMGIELKNPVIIGASNLVTNPDNIKKAEEAGAGAIVYKSLFEEQIQLEEDQLQDELSEYNERHAEMINLFPNIEHAGPKEHLVNLRNAKESIGIPLIASLNAIYKETWIDYAKQIEETGVDGLELNFYAVPRSFDETGSDIEKKQIEVLKEVKKAVSIPVSVKLSPFYANPLNVIKQMDKAGVDAFVLFNRLFQPNIDILDQKHVTDFHLSSAHDNQLPLRFAGLLHGEVKGSIISNTGIYTGEDVIKMILAGSDAVQVVSTVYKNKIDYITTILADISKWMDSNNYSDLNSFRGKLSNKSIHDPFVYKRAQYVDILMKSEKIMTKYPLR